MDVLRTFTLGTLFWLTAIVAAVAGAYAWMGLAGLVLFAGMALGVLPICWLIAMKACWPELEKPALVITFATTFLIPALVAAAIVLRTTL